MRSFNDLSNQIVANYKRPPPLRSPGEINDYLGRLRKLLAEMEDDVRHLLIERECENHSAAEYDKFTNHLSKALEPGDYDKLMSSIANASTHENNPVPLFTDGPNSDVLNGGSAVEKLERLVKKSFSRPVQRDGAARAKLIMQASLNFKSCGGEVASTVGSEFVRYVEDLSTGPGIKPIEGPSAVRYYLKRKS